MKRGIKFFALLFALTMIMSLIVGCGKPALPSEDSAAQQPSSTDQNKEYVPVDFSIEGEPMQEQFAVFSNDFLSIAYNDKFLRTDYSDDIEDVVSFESIGGVDIDMDIVYFTFGDYASAATNEYSYEASDPENISVSELSDVTLNGYNAKYFSIIEDDSCNEYYFIEYSGTANSGVTYVTIESDFPAAAAEAWIPRINASANTISFK